MKLRKILPYLYFLDKIKVFQYDAYKDKDHEPEEVFFGSSLDVPWWIAEMYLYRDIDIDSISIAKDAKEPYLEIAVVEKPYEEK
jgi:hypothetical protein